MRTKDFDSKEAIATYRRVIVRLESETSETAMREFRAIAMHLRRTWQERKGVDSLHEMAFRESND